MLTGEAGKTVCGNCAIFKFSVNLKFKIKLKLHIDIQHIKIILLYFEVVNYVEIFILGYYIYVGICMGIIYIHI